MILDRYGRTERTSRHKKGDEDYPVGGLSPLLLGWHHGLGGHRPAPEHFVVMDGNVGLLQHGPVEADGHQALVGQRGVCDTQAGWTGRRSRI